MNFASDNCSGVHPLVMDALVQANTGHAASYGDDAIMDRVSARFREVFEAPDAEVFLVATGSAANAVSLATLVEPWHAIYCHQHSHIQADECGAPEFYTSGARLVGINSDDGKITPGQLENAVKATPKGDVHTYQRGAVSLTNTTEAGTVYSCEELAAITAVARANTLPVHLDGARFANAVAHLGCSPAQASWKSGVDVLSFGGTKNGLMGVEAVVLFNPKKAWELQLRRKRGGHLFSKHRFLSAQMDAYLGDDLWLKTARAANLRAQQLSAGLNKIAGVKVTQSVQANIVFMQATRAQHRQAQAAGAKYSMAPYDTPMQGDADEILHARMVCSWSTTEQDVADMVAAFGG
ncbi:MAG: low specificity L-threonine aldolase [Paracoccaceae bacterium]